jgi:hypothetical protein
MSTTTVKVTTTRIDHKTGDNQILNMVFTNQDKAWQFYAKALNRTGVVNVTMPLNTMKTYNNVEKALADLAFFV